MQNSILTICVYILFVNVRMQYSLLFHSMSFKIFSFDIGILWQRRWWRRWRRRWWCRQQTTTKKSDKRNRVLFGRSLFDIHFVLRRLQHLTSWRITTTCRRAEKYEFSYWSNKIPIIFKSIWLQNNVIHSKISQRLRKSRIVEKHIRCICTMHDCTQLKSEIYFTTAEQISSAVHHTSRTKESER